MLVDLVVDTNVLMHASNPASGRQEQSGNLLERLYESTTTINVDTTGRILQEYLDYLVPGSAGSAFVAAMVRRGQLVRVESTPPQQDRKWIAKTISDSGDRAFLRTAVVSVEKLLTSHDFEDFPDRIRRKIRERLDVELLTADVTSPLV